MRVFAVDPGYGRLGIAILEKEGVLGKVIFSECFTTEKTLPQSERLKNIADRVRGTFKEFNPDCFAIEGLFFSKNRKTALAVAEARGAILEAAAQVGVPIYEYLPVQIKVAVTGYGKSDKAQVTEMVRRLTNVTGKRLDDEYDAIAVALTHIATWRPESAQ